jgi:hypothetical protein
MESVLKNIFKRGYEEIRDRKLLEILGHGSNTNYTPFLSYGTAVFILSVPMHCSATRRFLTKNSTKNPKSG